jgi:hypothetical protein
MQVLILYAKALHVLYRLDIISCYLLIQKNRGGGEPPLD